MNYLSNDLTMTSLEVVDLINKFRLEEGNDKVKERHLHIYQQKGKRVMKWTLEGAVLIYMELEKQLGLLPTKEVAKLG